MSVNAVTFMEVAQVFARRSTCIRGQVGAVVVQDRRIVATGYNGAPPGQPHCTQVGCEEYELPAAPGDKDYQVSTGCQRAIHAEANAIAWAARAGIRLEGATIYTTHAPCYGCAKLILASGIAQVIYERPYRLTQGIDLLRAAGVKQHSMEWELTHGD